MGRLPAVIGWLPWLLLLTACITSQPGAPTAPRPAPDRLLSRGNIQVAEVHLHAFGFDPGPVDGVYTAETRAAVRAYQARYGLPDRFRYDGAILPAWLPAAKRADGAMLMGRLSPQRRDHARQYLDQMRILRTSGRWWPRPSKRWRGSCPERQINPR